MNAPARRRSSLEPPWNGVAWLDLLSCALGAFLLLLLVFAGVTWRELEPRLRSWPRPLQIGCVLLAVSGDLVRIPQARRADRVVLVELGRYLGAQLEPGETVATDMPRLGSDWPTRS